METMDEEGLQKDTSDSIAESKGSNQGHEEDMLPVHTTTTIIDDAHHRDISEHSTVADITSMSVANTHRRKPSKRRRLSLEHDDERTNYIVDVVNTLNSNDEDACRTLIFRLCNTDCIYMERYFDILPVLPVYREMIGPEQIYNYVFTIFQCIPDALLKHVGSKLYERTDGTSYLIGQLKFSGIGFCNVTVSDVVHNSARFLSKDSMFSAIYGTVPTSAANTTATDSSSAATAAAAVDNVTVDKELIVRPDECFAEEARQDLHPLLAATREQYNDHSSSPIPIHEDFKQSAILPSSLSVDTLNNNNNINNNNSNDNGNNSNNINHDNSNNNNHSNSNSGIAVLSMFNKRNNRKKTAINIPITPNKVLVSTISSRYSVSTPRKTPYKLDMDVTMVFHIDTEWKVWKCESYNHGTMKFKPK